MMVAQQNDRGITFGDLFGDQAPESINERTVDNVFSDSRYATAGGLFLARSGAGSHGLDHLGDATRRGAAYAAWEPAPGYAAPELCGDVFCFPVAGLGARMGETADLFFKSPSAKLDVIGVTGTNGKTSCTSLVAQALENCGRPSGMIGTLGAGRTGDLADAGLTTPDVVEVHRALAAIREHGGKAVAMEVSSHALDQARVDAVQFKIAAFTNLTRDHLDYHGTFEAYAQAKQRLFTAPGLMCAVVNGDDPYGRRLLDQIPAAVETVCVGHDEKVTADRCVKICAMQSTRAGLSIDFDSSWGQGRIESPLWGDFNADNLALALAILLVLEIPLDQALSALSRVEAPAGRLEVFAAQQRTSKLPAVVVDYAHTPDALAKALHAVRAHTQGKVGCVFGCGGERDSGKRPEMGEIAGRLADFVIVTDDNPRGEDGGQIIAEILAGMSATPRVERDRESAIRLALGESGSGDVILVAGKGHENYQLVAGERRRYSDRLVVQALLGADRD
jgi:UDP-N-acetylmuramoyl-L-alanyl-D-glutamate--2,6-diaminopimelate ligase